MTLDKPPPQVSKAPPFRDGKGASQSGFSLIEVVCAVAILGLGLVGLTAGLTTALQSTKDAERQTAAALYAAGLIETLRAEGFLTDGETEGDCGDAFPGHQWRQTLSSSTTDGLHDVVVVVEDSRTAKPVFELRTLLFEPPSSLSDGASQSGQGSTARNRERERRRQR